MDLMASLARSASTSSFAMVFTFSFERSRVITVAPSNSLPSTVTALVSETNISSVMFLLRTSESAFTTSETASLSSETEAFATF